MDEAESYSSSIYAHFSNLYKSDSQKELILKLIFYPEQTYQESTDFVEGFPPSVYLFSCRLFEAMFPYDHDEEYLRQVDIEHVHHDIIQSIEHLCDMHYHFMITITLPQYQKLVNQVLSVTRYMNKGKILTLWYFTLLLQDKFKNASAKEMMKYFKEKISVFMLQ